MKSLHRSLAAVRRREESRACEGFTHGLIGNSMAEIGQSTDDAVVSPTRVLSCEADNKRPRPRGRRRGRPGEVRNLGPSNLRAISRRYQARIVFWFGDTGNLLKSRARPSHFADLGEGGALGFEAHTGWKMSSEDAILAARYSFWSRSF